MSTKKERKRPKTSSSLQNQNSVDQQYVQSYIIIQLTDFDLFYFQSRKSMPSSQRILRRFHRASRWMATLPDSEQAAPNAAIVVKNAFGYKAPYSWDDPFLFQSQLTEEERAVWDATRDFCQGQLMPGILHANRHEKTLDHALMQEMGQTGLLGATLPVEYGGSGLGYVSYGLLATEVERVDSAYRSAMSVQSSLVMYPIYAYGNEELRQKYLPRLAAGEWIGCFGLTEPNHGSDPGNMETRAVYDSHSNEYP